MKSEGKISHPANPTKILRFIFRLIVICDWFVLALTPSICNIWIGRIRKMKLTRHRNLTLFIAICSCVRREINRFAEIMRGYFNLSRDLEYERDTQRRAETGNAQRREGGTEKPRKGARGPRARLDRTTREWTLAALLLWMRRATSGVSSRRLRVINSFTTRIIML